jgi:hypothetical protein
MTESYSITFFFRKSIPLNQIFKIGQVNPHKYWAKKLVFGLRGLFRHNTRANSSAKLPMGLSPLFLRKD